MKRKILIFISWFVAITVTLFVSYGFVAYLLPQQELDNIVKEIPDEWWEGGWDKLSELRALQEKYPDNISVCAQAQYYIAGYYYSTRQHDLAIQEYQSLIGRYPQAWLECQKAQFEMGQIYIYRLNNPQQAILEYQKALTIDPKSYIAPMAQRMLGYAYGIQGDYTQALVEYNKVLEKYPKAKLECSLTNLEIGDLLREEAYSLDSSQASEKQLKLSQAMSAYKKAYFDCPLENVDVYKRAVESIYRTFASIDGNLTRATNFLVYQKYGAAGMDGILNTADDLADPLKDF